MVIRLMTILCLTLCGTAAISAAQDQPKPSAEEKRHLYKWTDSDGTVHLTDDQTKVPEQFRKNVQIIEESPSRKTESSGAQQPAVQPVVPQTTDGNEHLKSMWQQRMAAERRKKAAAEAKYRQLMQDRDRLQEQWGYGLYGYSLEVSRRLDQLNLQIDQAKKELDAAEVNIEETIPEEARKAGVPPGWLRE